MAYTPGRKDGYEYLWDLISDIEKKQCVTCRFRKNPDDDGQHATEYPVCYEVEAEIIAENGPVGALDLTPEHGVVCTKYRQGDPWDCVVDPDQLTLGDK